MSHNIHLRHVDEVLMYQLKHNAEEHNISVNTLILNLLKKTLGLSEHRLDVYHDLDKLAGTWGKQEAKTFLKTISDFEQTDKDIW